MSGPSPRIVAGGPPSPAEAAALGAAVAALIDAEAAASAAPPGPPAAYGSRWRRAALIDALRPLPAPAELTRGWRS